MVIKVIIVIRTSSQIPTTATVIMLVLSSM